jgi:hypothetical protein
MRSPLFKSRRYSTTAGSTRRAARGSAVALLACAGLVMGQPAGLQADEISAEAALERFLASNGRRPPSYRAYRSSRSPTPGTRPRAGSK